MIMKTRQQRTALRQTGNVVRAGETQRDIAIVQARLQASQTLTLADENDFGGDPYNSTGQHATLGAIKKNQR